jgi:hypothetical protein
MIKIYKINILFYNKKLPYGVRYFQEDWIFWGIKLAFLKTEIAIEGKRVHKLS